MNDPLALTPQEEDHMVAVLLLTGLATRDDVYRAANARFQRLRRGFTLDSIPTLRNGWLGG